MAVTESLLAVVASVVLQNGGRLRLTAEDFGEGDAVAGELCFEEDVDDGLVVRFRG